MSSIVPFEEKPPEGTIHFGVGQPSADLLLVELMREATEEFFRSASPEDLDYGAEKSCATANRNAREKEPAIARRDGRSLIATPLHATRRGSRRPGIESPISNTQLALISKAPQAHIR